MMTQQMISSLWISHECECKPGAGCMLTYTNLAAVRMHMIYNGAHSVPDTSICRMQQHALKIAATCLCHSTRHDTLNSVNCMELGGLCTCRCVCRHYLSGPIRVCDKDGVPAKPGALAPVCTVSCSLLLSRLGNNANRPCAQNITPLHKCMQVCKRQPHLQCSWTHNTPANRCNRRPADGGAMQSRPAAW